MAIIKTDFVLLPSEVLNRIGIITAVEEEDDDDDDDLLY